MGQGRSSSSFARCSVLLLMLMGCSLLGSEPSASPRPKFGGVVTIGVVGAAISDPALAEGSALTTLKAACDTIVRVTPDKGIAEPELGRWSFAEKADGLRIELDNTRFADGGSLSAQSVISTWTRALSPTTASPWASLLERVTGFDEFREGSAPAVSGLTKGEGGSLNVQLAEPYSEITSVLSHPGFIPLSERAIAKATTEASPVAPVCAGPFEIQPGAGEGDVRLRRRLEYRGNDPGLADVIVVRSFESEKDAFDAFLKGEVDLAPLPSSEVSRAESPGSRLTSHKLSVTHLLIDVSKPELADPRLRQALSLSFDRLAIIDAAFGDGRLAATGWLAPFERVQSGSSCSEFAKKIADPERAKQILESAGLGPGLRVPIFFDKERTDRLVAQGLQVQAKDALGIELVPTALDPPQFEESLKARSEAGTWLVSTNPALPGGDFQLGSLFQTGSPANYSRFSNEDFDRTVAAARATVPSDERLSTYRRAEEIVCEAMPSIPLWRGVENWIFKQGKVNFEGEKFDASGELLLRHIYGG